MKAKFTIRVIVACMILFLGFVHVSSATVYTVTNNLDANATTGLNQGDLRWCMNQAFAAAGPHTIQFNIGGGGVQTITLANDLPAINAETDITIDATTQPGYIDKPLIVISRVGNNGFNISNGCQNIIIKGFVIVGFQRGVLIDNNCRFISILGNYINLNQAGTTVVAGGQTGIFIQNCPDVIIGGYPRKNRNIIVGGTNHGIETAGACHRLIVRNNFIGVRENGTGGAGFGFTTHGIFINGGSTSCVVEGNVLSGNGQDGILVDASSHWPIITGNKVGTDSTGTVSFGNGKEGVMVQNSRRPTIDNNVIANSGINGILIVGTSDSSRIRGNKIGVNINGVGTTFSNRANGIYINVTSPSRDHIIGGATVAERNIISNNGNNPVCSAPEGNGILFDNVRDSYIMGNYIGVDASGNVALGNDNSGILIQQTSVNITIGGINAGEGNVISANGAVCSGGTRHGIQLNGSAVTNVSIVGNYIGVGADGTTPLGNRQDGVSVLGSGGNTIGGNTAAHRNVISANTVGVYLQQGTANNNLILGNYIGTDYTGTLARGNTYSGIGIGNDAGISTGPNNIGRANLGEGNLISGNLRAGIRLNANGAGGGTPSEYTLIYNNTIGLSATGNPLPNDTGIVINEGANDNFIGGSVALQPNVIAYNNKNGIWINGGTSNKNWISRNSIYCNGSSYAAADPENKGINLNGTGNNNYPAPVVYSIGALPNSDANNLRGTAPPNSIVEVFSTELCLTCPVGGGVQVEGYIYRATVTADGSGNWIWTPGGALSGQYTATATEPSGTTRNTSEFATCGYINLPVDLISFTGRAFLEGVVLNWITVTEKNNSHFKVQRSQDGIYFETIGRVEGNNNSSEIVNYSFLDSDPGESFSYYRLLQVDFDGTSSFSKTIRVTLDEENEVRIFPNPASEYINIYLSFSSGKEYGIIVSDLVGKDVLSANGTVSSGTDQKQLDISTLSSGVYFIYIHSEGQVWVEKFVKK